MIWLLQVAAGAWLLARGARWLVEGSAALALELRVPQLVVGLTIVASGTSAPELVVGWQAAAAGHQDVALGNIVGSNIANIGLILGTAVLIRPQPVDGRLRELDLPAMLLSTVLVMLGMWNAHIDAWEAWTWIVLGVGYLAVVVWREWREGRTSTAGASPAGEPGRTAARSLLTLLVGLGVLLVGSNLFLDGAVHLARYLAVSERLIGLTLVAVGTSLPELVSSLVAAVKGHAGIALGNVVGSNIFNVLVCLSTAALAGSVGSAPGAASFDLATLALMTVLCAFYLRQARTMGRRDGAVLLGVYGLYTASILARG